MATRAAWLAGWRARHRSRLSLGLHLVGIPLTVAAAGLAGYQLCLWRWELWYRPGLLLAAGYLLQFLGHRHEGSEMGELMVLRRLLGRARAAARRADAC